MLHFSANHWSTQLLQRALLQRWNAERTGSQSLPNEESYWIIAKCNDLRAITEAPTTITYRQRGVSHSGSIMLHSLQRSTLKMDSVGGTWMQRFSFLSFFLLLLLDFIRVTRQSQSPSNGKKCSFSPQTRADQNCKKTAEWRRLDRRPRLRQSPIPIQPHHSTWHSTFPFAT